MNLSSCRELKSQLLLRAYALPGETRHLRSYHLPKAARVAAKQQDVQASERTPVAALGVAPAREKDFKLAVRIFKGEEHRESQLLEGLARHAKEMDVARGVRYKPRAGITVRAGGSCGHYKITAGTLGGFVEGCRRLLHDEQQPRLRQQQPMFWSRSRASARATGYHGQLPHHRFA